MRSSLEAYDRGGLEGGLDAAAAASDPPGRLWRGRPKPLGATFDGVGTQFALFSRHARLVTLLLFERPSDREPRFQVAFDPEHHRTGDIWHLYVAGVKPGALYLYRVDGPYDPENGHRFNRNKLLIDPYARALTDGFVHDVHAAVGCNRDAPEADLSFSEASSAAVVPKCIVVDDDFDWQGDAPLNVPLQEAVVYEAHLRGLTMHPSSEVSNPGTYLGVVEKIPYLRELGITSLELLPVQEFNEHEVDLRNPTNGELLQNYWGYSPVAFFAPKASYAADAEPGAQVAEFKYMVRELHKAGIEVILDVVFNHTGEGNELGPTYSFRGLDNSIYYILDRNKRYYRNFSGCGNTVNCNHPIVRQLILDCLHYWVMEMHIDGFRFDLGSILGRDGLGRMMENPPVVEHIAQDPILRDTKLIAEAWDAAGAYQVGWFPGGRWAEWNDKFRDDVRKFWNLEHGDAAQLATRLSGSADLYLRDGRKPFHSINFVTSHDGFTLYDLVSYSRKYNYANGENNRDGHNANYSYNHGIEGETDHAEVNRLRMRQRKNFISTLLLSQGTPMILGGDEIGRTQRGNNNAYCHNSELAWLDYTGLPHDGEFLRYVREMVAFRRRHPAIGRGEFFTGGDHDFDSLPDIDWLSPDGRAVDWTTAGGRLAVRIDGGGAETRTGRDDSDLLLLFNASSSAVAFLLPSDATWGRVIDTYLDPPEDICGEDAGPRFAPGSRYRVVDKALAVFVSCR